MNKENAFTSTAEESNDTDNNPATKSRSFHNNVEMRPDVPYSQERPKANGNYPKLVYENYQDA